MKTRFVIVVLAYFYLPLVIAEEQLKILTVNLHSYQELKQESDSPPLRITRNQPILARVAQAINYLDVDVVCLQEVGEWQGDVSNPDSAPFGQGKSNAANIIKKLLRNDYHLFMDWSHYAWDEWREGTAILSKTPFIKTESRFVSHSKSHHNWKSRKVVGIETHVDGFGAISVISAHTGWWNDKEEPFQYQFENIAKWRDVIKANTHLNEVLICGDLNIKAGSKGYKMITQQYDFTDAYLLANPRGLTDATIGKGIDTVSGKGDRIDYLLLDGDSSLKVKSAKRIFTKSDYGRVSDHLGVFFILQKNK